MHKFIASCIMTMCISVAVAADITTYPTPHDVDVGDDFITTTEILSATPDDTQCATAEFANALARTAANNIAHKHNTSLMPTITVGAHLPPTTRKYHNRNKKTETEETIGGQTKQQSFNNGFMKTFHGRMFYAQFWRVRKYRPPWMTKR